MERPAFAIDNITLFESILSPKGPAYSVVEQIKLHA
jgi:2'-5' RNA ligase